MVSFTKQTVKFKKARPILGIIYLGKKKKSGKTEKVALLKTAFPQTLDAFLQLLQEATELSYWEWIGRYEKEPEKLTLLFYVGRRLAAKIEVSTKPFKIIKWKNRLGYLDKYYKEWYYLRSQKTPLLEEFMGYKPRRLPIINEEVSVYRITILRGKSHQKLKRNLAKINQTKFLSPKLFYIIASKTLERERPKPARLVRLSDIEPI